MILKDKVVIISGVGPGMGRKLALLCAKEGAEVAIGARNKDFLASLSKEIQAAGGQVTSSPCDVAKDGDCKALVDATVKAFGRVDGLVNAAYQTGGFSMFEDSNMDDWRAAMDVTCFGALRLAKLVTPIMKKQGGGAIVNVGSQVTRKPLPMQGGYMIGKAALQGVTRQLAVELGPHNIRVNMALPGWMWGAPVEGYIKGEVARGAATEKQLVDGIAANIALRRIPPDDECARAVVFLLSEYASVVTGASLDVNGGEYIPQ